MRIERRWTFDQVRRAALALAREVERRAPALATSKWWKEERHGVFLDYNQNAKDRTVAGAYSVRPTAGCARVGAADLGRGRRLRSADFTLATMPARFAAIGDRHAAIDAHAGSLDALLELSARQERDGLGDAPWPPHYKKQPGEPPRVAAVTRRRVAEASAASRSAVAAAKKDDALAGARALEGAASGSRSAPRSRPTCWSMRCAAASRTWTRIRINLQHVPEDCGRRRRRSTRTKTWATDWSPCS